MAERGTKEPLDESEVAQLCLTLCDLMDCSLPGSSIHGIFQAKSTGVGCHFLLQGIFLTQQLNLGLYIAGRRFTIWATREVLKVKEENEKADLKLNIQKTKIMASGPITSRQIEGETMETVRD